MDPSGHIEGGRQQAAGSNTPQEKFAQPQHPAACCKPLQHAPSCWQGVLHFPKVTKAMKTQTKPTKYIPDTLHIFNMAESNHRLPFSCCSSPHFHFTDLY